jgi:hypothetical protein
MSMANRTTNRERLQPVGFWRCRRNRSPTLEANRCDQSSGLSGARAIRQAGGRVITEAESSCIVHGMPRAVAEAGLSNSSVALEGLPALIRRLLLEA